MQQALLQAPRAGQLLHFGHTGGLDVIWCHWPTAEADVRVPEALEAAGRGRGGGREGGPAAADAAAAALAAGAAAGAAASARGRGQGGQKQQRQRRGPGVPAGPQPAGAPSGDAPCWTAVKEQLKSGLWSGGAAADCQVLESMQQAVFCLSTPCPQLLAASAHPQYE
jgi:hypothetical protein